MAAKAYKGIILAGGSGSRLRPLTDLICKQLLPVFNKPLIYYPLSSMILAGIRDILIISTPQDTPILEKSLGNGKRLGISIQYMVQRSPDGLPDAFLLGEKFLQGHPCCLILGDNIIHAANFSERMGQVLKSNKGATIFGFPVNDPRPFGVVEWVEASKRVISFEEKPKKPKSNLAAIGLYVFDADVVKKARTLKASKRGELEIVDLCNLYLAEKRLNFHRLSRGDMWIDAGTFDSLADASQLIRLIETRLGQKIGCPEEATFVMHNISAAQLEKIAKQYNSTPYGDYLRKIVD